MAKLNKKKLSQRGWSPRHHNQQTEGKVCQLNPVTSSHSVTLR